MNTFIFIHDKKPYRIKKGFNIKCYIDPSIKKIKFSPTFTSKEDLEKHYELELQKL